MLHIPTLLVVIITTVIATASMLYVALVTGIGPWVGPVVGLVMQALVRAKNTDYTRRLAVIVTATASIGGIAAVAFGFSFPTWFFLDKTHFLQLQQQPYLFMGLIASFVFVMGVVAHGALGLFYNTCVHDQKLPFPVSAITYDAVHDYNTKHHHYLLSGIFSYVGYWALFCKNLLGRYACSMSFTLTRGYSLWFINVPACAIDFSVMPLLLSVGFIAGSLIAIPLVVGVILKSTLFAWLYSLYAHIHYESFLFALCSGIVLSSTVMGLYKQTVGLFRSGMKSVRAISFCTLWSQEGHKKFTNLILVGMFCVFGVYMYCASFSLLSIVYLFAGALICSYQMAVIAGKLGLALLGRFATFVMVPGILLFTWSPLQITFVATCVELVGGMLVDLINSRKMLEMSSISFKETRIYYLVALIAAVCSIAFFFYYCVEHYELGSSVLSAQRSQARALLLQVTQLDYIILLYGTLVGCALQFLRCNPILVLSGLLMPIYLLIPLIVGGLLTKIIAHPKRYEPFFSGVYIANSCASILALFI